MIAKKEVTTPEMDNSSNESANEEMSEEESNEESGDGVHNEESSEAENNEEMEEEFVALNMHLDKLGTVLDNLEKKNDDIHAQLVELLEANRQVKMMFQENSPSQDEPSKG